MISISLFIKTVSTNTKLIGNDPPLRARDGETTNRYLGYYVQIFLTSAILI